MVNLIGGEDRVPPKNPPIYHM